MIRCGESMTKMRRIGHGLIVLAALAATGCGGNSDAAGQAGVSPEGGAVIDDHFSVSTALSSVIPTVATVTWSIEGVTSLDEAHIDFGKSSGTYGMTAPAQVDGAGPWQTILIGMKPSTEYHFRITARSGAQSYVSASRTVTTGNVEPKLPTASVTMNDASKHAQGFMLTTMLAVPPAAVILDSDGDYVWWYLPPTPDRDLELSRARMTADHQWVYMWSVNLLSTGDNPGGPGTVGSLNQRIIKVRIDGSDEQEVSIPNGHHDFTILPDGTIGYIEYDVRTVDSRTVAGDRLMERKPDGSTTEIYSVWNDFQYDGQPIPEGAGWCHANFLEYHEDENVYYMGSKTFGSILKIDRATGKLLHAFGGTHSDFTVSTGGTTPYEDQHGFQVQGNDLLVFDNGPQQRMSSRSVEYTFDESSKLMTLVWSYTPSPTLFNFSMGNALHLPNGNRLVSFAISGQVDEVDSSSNLVWRLNLGLGGALGYVTWKESLYE